MEGNTIAVLPHRCSVTQGVLVTEAVIVPALEANNIPVPVNMVKETDWIPEQISSGSTECHPVIQKEHHLFPNSLHPKPCSLP